MPGTKGKGRGNNGSQDLYLLQAINKVVNAITGGIPMPSGLATESTLSTISGTALNILNALSTSGQDIEILLVRDKGNSDLVVKQITDASQTPYIITYADVDGNAYTPVGPLEYLDPSDVMNLMLTELVSLNTTDFATETTLASILTEATSLGNTVSTEATLVALLTAFNGEDFATEATLAGGLQAISLLLQSLDNKDFATETTLTALAATDFATETTLGGLNSKFNTLGQKTSSGSTPVVLSTEQEAILNAIVTSLNTLDTSNLATEVTLNSLLTTANSIDGKDFSTETTLAALLLAFNNTDFATENTLSSLEGKDFATEVTLGQALLELTNLVNKDFATETTLSHVDVGVTAIVSALDVALSTRASEVTALAIDTKLAPVNRTHNTRNTVISGVIAAGSLRGSVLNAGNVDGTWNGMVIPPGVSIPWGDVGNKDPYGAISYDPTSPSTGTRFIIEYTI